MTSRLGSAHTAVLPRMWSAAVSQPQHSTAEHRTAAVLLHRCEEALLSPWKRLDTTACLQQYCSQWKQNLMLQLILKAILTSATPNYCINSDWGGHKLLLTSNPETKAAVTAACLLSCSVRSLLKRALRVELNSEKEKKNIQKRFPPKNKSQKQHADGTQYKDHQYKGTPRKRLGFTKEQPGNCKWDRYKKESGYSLQAVQAHYSVTEAELCYYYLMQHYKVTEVQWLIADSFSPWEECSHGPTAPLSQVGMTSPRHKHTARLEERSPHDACLQHWPSLHLQTALSSSALSLGVCNAYETTPSSHDHLKHPTLLPSPRCEGANCTQKDPSCSSPAAFGDRSPQRKPPSRLCLVLTQRTDAWTYLKVPSNTWHFQLWILNVQPRTTGK